MARDMVPWLLDNTARPSMRRPYCGKVRVDVVGFAGPSEVGIAVIVDKIRAEQRKNIETDSDTIDHHRASCMISRRGKIVSRFTDRSGAVTV